MPSWLSIALREPLWLSKADPHRGGSISLQPFLGHAKLEATQVYAESTTAMIKESYQKALSR